MWFYVENFKEKFKEKMNKVLIISVNNGHFEFKKKKKREIQTGTIEISWSSLYIAYNPTIHVYPKNIELT